MGNSSSFRRSPPTLDKAAQQRLRRHLGHASIAGRYHRLPRHLEDDYDISKTALGSGYNGDVLLAKCRITGMSAAVKCFKLQGVSADKRRELATEAEIFLGMDHPHVVQLQHVYEDEDRLSIVMERMEGGELFDRLAHRKVFKETDAASAAYQMLLPVSYIHSHGIAHRDLKLENFLYEKKDNDFLKLIDFGFSKNWENKTHLVSSCGTLSYMAPQVINRHYTSQCDLWSLGVIVFALLVGYMPFGGASNRQLLSAIKKGKYLVRRAHWACVSNEAFDFVQRLLVVDERARFTAREALKHPWITKRHPQGFNASQVDEGIARALLGFARASPFRQSVLRLMTWSLTAEERGQVRGAFLELDTQKTGSIRLSELKQVFEAKLNMPDEESVAIYQALSATHDGINYSEFLAAMEYSVIAVHNERLTTTFRRFDLKNQGYIRPKDLEKVLGDEVNAREVMRQMDANRDGKITHAEFSACLDSGHSEHVAAAAAGCVDEAPKGGVGAEREPAVQLQKLGRFWGHALRGG